MAYSIGILMPFFCTYLVAQENPCTIPLAQLTIRDNAEQKKIKTKSNTIVSWHHYLGDIPYSIARCIEHHSLKMPAELKQSHIFIIHGSSGVGKTTLIESLAREVKAKLIVLEANKFLGNFPMKLNAFGWGAYMDNPAIIRNYFKSFLNECFNQERQQYHKEYLFWFNTFNVLTDRVGEKNVLTFIQEIINECNSKQGATIFFAGEQESDPSEYYKINCNTIRLDLPDVNARTSLFKYFTAQLLLDKELKNRIGNIDTSQIKWSEINENADELTGKEIKRIVEQAFIKFLAQSQLTGQAHNKATLLQELLKEATIAHNKQIVTDPLAHSHNKSAHSMVL